MIFSRRRFLLFGTAILVPALVLAVLAWRSFRQETVERREEIHLRAEATARAALQDLEERLRRARDEGWASVGTDPEALAAIGREQGLALAVGVENVRSPPGELLARRGSTEFPPLAVTVHLADPSRLETPPARVALTGGRRSSAIRPTRSSSCRSGAPGTASTDRPRSDAKAADALKAKSAFRRAWCLEKKGDKVEAERLYREVTAKYATQAETAAEARERLDRLVSGNGADDARGRLLAVVRQIAEPPSEKGTGNALWLLTAIGDDADWQTL